MSLVSPIILSLELYGTAVFIAIMGLATTYSSLAMRRTLIDRTYRSRAMWTGLLAAGMVALMFTDSVTYSPLFPNPTFLQLLPHDAVLVAVVVILAAWIDSTIRIAIDQDYYHRNTLSWLRLRYLFWPGALYTAISFIGNQNPLPGILSFGFASVTLYVSGTRTPDITMRFHLRWIALFAVTVFLEGVALFLLPVPTLVALAFGAYFLYRAGRSLAPTSKLSLGSVTSES